MTKNYTKPIVTIDSGMAEGVYAASGCYTASAYIHQTPETVSYTHLTLPTT